MNARHVAVCMGLMAALGFPVRAKAADTTTPLPCQVLKVEELDAETLPTGMFAVPAILNDKPHRLLVDTGSPHSSITADVAKQLGVSAEYAPIGSFLNNAAISHYGYLNSFGFAHLRANQKWVVFIDTDNLLAPSLSGLLGADVMANYDVEFDFFGGKLNFFKPNTCPTPVYWSKAYAEVPISLDSALHVVVDATLDGKPVKVLLDTGSSASVMSLEAARSLFGWRADDPRVKYRATVRINGGPPAPISYFPFGSLDFGGVAVQNPKIQLIPHQNFDAHGRDDASIILGVSVLRQLHLYIGYQSKKLYLTGAEAH